MIYLSESAVKRIRRFVSKETGSIGVRIGINRSGCSGYGYQIDMIESVSESQQIFDYDDFKIAINREDVPFLHGVKMDVKKQGLNETFVFENPQAQATCGCGNSFSLE